MKTKILLLLSLFTILISCSKHNEYSEFVDFGRENRWQKADAKTFEFDISDAKVFNVDVTDDNQLYTMTLLFSHVYDYQFASIPINFSIENPSGETEKFSVDLAIKDSNGKELGECAGDICDLNYIIKEKTKLQKGIYKVTISHSFEGPYLPNVLGVGLSVEAVK
ncbi:gliding motility lipoprotein GldH [Flavobacterium sp. AS60]|uniref:gliding motility lipoprotein GldH n=1 Tax=Flavobacterium anseongense TaxID=2910677 RepID=UPI001F21D8E4|nr:gliding motility lipoprotein GldH [Flavobacterium sp. AS60]MCF6129363.1 gliding motility lipoprotein GldH [Flavobacterium sp. AS60]